MGAASKTEHQVLVVCTGNVCRSPMGEYILRHRLGADTKWTVQSAGVHAMDGCPASGEAVEAVKEWDIDLKPHRSAAITKEMVNASTLVVVMTEHHRWDVAHAFPEAQERVHLLTSFGSSQPAQNISDPIGGSLNVYRTIRDQIDSAVSDLVLTMRDRWGL